MLIRNNPEQNQNQFKIKMCFDNHLISEIDIKSSNIKENQCFKMESKQASLKFLSAVTANCGKLSFNDPGFIMN